MTEMKRMLESILECLCRNNFPSVSELILTSLIFWYKFSSLTFRVTFITTSCYGFKVRAASSSLPIPSVRRRPGSTWAHSSSHSPGAALALLAWRETPRRPDAQTHTSYTLMLLRFETKLDQADFCHCHFWNPQGHFLFSWHWSWSEVLAAVVMKRPLFWDITLCSTLSVNRRFRGTCRLHLQGRRVIQVGLWLPPAFMLVSCFDYSTTLKMEATRSPETSVEFQRTTRHYIP
jgi:hypothetical protein